MRFVQGTQQQPAQRGERDEGGEGGPQGDGVGDGADEGAGDASDADGRRTRLRLYHALRMLADGMPVTAVARRCGWSSAGAFIDVFRRAYGYTPGARERGWP